MNIILFGEMSSGKSTIAKYLQNTYGYKKFSLGEKIHSECELYKKHDRHHMQKYGQMMRDVFGINVWTDYVFNQTIGINGVVIDDGRQLNEYDYYIEKGYLPVGVITDDNIRIERLKQRINYTYDPTTSQHETEVQARACVNKCKIKIYNNSDDFNDLIKEIETKLNEYIRGK